MAGARDVRTQRRYFIDNVILTDYGAELGPVGISVYNALCLHANLQTQKCWPSRKRIAALTGTSVSTVARALRKLQELKLISVEARTRPDGGRSSSLYLILDPPEVTVNPSGATHDSSATQGGVSDCPTTNNPNIEQSYINEGEAIASADASDDDTPIQESEKEEKTKRALSEKEQFVRALSDEFTRATRINPPKNFKARNRMWFGPMRAIGEMVEWSIPRGQALLQEAIQSMWQQKLTIASPLSIEKVALGIESRRFATERPLPSNEMAFRWAERRKAELGGQQ